MTLREQVRSSGTYESSMMVPSPRAELADLTDYTSTIQGIYFFGLNVSRALISTTRWAVWSVVGRRSRENHSVWYRVTGRIGIGGACGRLGGLFLFKACIQKCVCDGDCTISVHRAQDPLARSFWEAAITVRKNKNDQQIVLWIPVAF